MNTSAPDFYAPIHKAIRFALADMVKQFGATDPADSDAWRRIAQRWTEIEAILHAHSHHEDNHFHPLIRAAAPDVAALLDAQHEKLDATVVDIGRRFAAIDSVADANARRERGRDLYRAYTAFMADYFHHLLEEETRAMPALLAAYPVDKLLAVHRALLAEIGPAQMLADLPLIIQALAPHERVGLMMGARATGPREFFETARKTAIGALAPQDGAALELALAA